MQLSSNLVVIEAECPHGPFHCPVVSLGIAHILTVSCQKLFRRESHRWPLAHSILRAGNAAKTMNAGIPFWLVRATSPSLGMRVCDMREAQHRLTSSWPRSGVSHGDRDLQGRFPDKPRVRSCVPGTDSVTLKKRLLNTVRSQWYTHRRMIVEHLLFPQPCGSQVFWSQEPLTLKNCQGLYGGFVYVGYSDWYLLYENSENVCTRNQNRVKIMCMNSFKKNNNKLMWSHD